MLKDSPMEKVRAVAAGDSDLERALWRKTAELGLHGLIVPEDCGGLGLGLIDLIVVLEALGHGLSPLPFIPQALAAAALLIGGDDRQKSEWLPGLASGESRWAIGLYDESNWIAPEAVTFAGRDEEGGVVLGGAKPHIAGGTSADTLLLAFRSERGVGLARIDAGKAIVKAQPCMDATKGNASVLVDGLFVPGEDIVRLDGGQLARLADLGALAVAAESAGAAQAALSMTSGYARERIQFGRPIGQYQGVKHRLADIYVDVESLKSLVYHAAWAADHDPDALPRAVSLAKGYGSDAFAALGIDCVQIHGAVGYTAEYDIQLYLKRAKWARPMFGDSDFHLDRLAGLGGL
jgi:alkylation response protein AidB-like acyl-CoA dehydrogenase